MYLQVDFLKGKKLLGWLSLFCQTFVHDIEVQKSHVKLNKIFYKNKKITLHVG